MKQLKWLVVIAVALFSVSAFADSGATLPAPSWIVSAVKDLENIPAIGHLIVLLMSIIAVVSAVITPLTALLMAIEKALNLTKLIPAINFLNQKVIPALAYVSNFNSQLGTSTQPAATVAGSGSATK